jgi:hypothetical protein
LNFWSKKEGGREETYPDILIQGKDYILMLRLKRIKQFRSALAQERGFCIVKM